MTQFKKIDSGKIYDYFACSDGYVLKVTKKTYNESRVCAYYRRGDLSVKINQKEQKLKHIIARAFIPKYKPGMCVTFKDGNRYNCAATNLLVYNKRELGEKTGHMSRARDIKIMFPDGEIKHYRSIRQAAKDLYVSYQTLADYIKGSTKSSVLSEYKIIKGEKS